IVAGAVLLLLETILPGLIAGILGMLCLIAGMTAGFVVFGARTGVWIVLGVVACSLIVVGIYAKVFPESRVARKFVSQRTIGVVGAEKPELLNQMGVAHTN